MRERQIALHPGHHSRLHKLVEYIILAAERRRVAAQSRWHLDHLGMVTNLIVGWRRNGPAANQQFQISNFKFQNQISNSKFKFSFTE
jgi:hypothetical protein